MAKNISRGKITDPSELKITERRASYLARESGLDINVLRDKKISEVNELVKWKVDPQLLLFRRVCGQVLKREADGSLCPVSGATVHVEDTDCSFFAFFPAEPPFFWLFPIKCNREELATVTTDACGRFCVNLPYWDIDRILRIRRERICFGSIFKPRLRDIIELLPEPPKVRIPLPEPDPVPLEMLTSEVIEQVRPYFGHDVADQLAKVVSAAQLGTAASELNQLLAAPLPSMPPPLSPELVRNKAAARSERTPDAALSDLPMEAIDVRRYIGPFVACRDVWRIGWVPFFDVPDITFRVTQDIDGNGNEEEIYREGFFDVRWNASANLYATLIADASALCSPICEPVQLIPCTDVPKISTAGYMTLEHTHHENTTGYGRRVNRPAPAPGDYPPPPFDGSPPANAASPYAKTLNLHGCHRIGDATHYRLTYVVNGIGTPAPFTDISWWAPKSAAAGGPPIHVVSDAEGWYPILDATLVEHPSWLLYWNTRRFSDATYDVRLEVGKPGTGGMDILHTSDPVKFVVDNSVPEPGFIFVEWRYAGTGDPWSRLPAVCPVITRDPAKAVRVRVRWQATAQHLRDALLRFSGCGGGSPVMVDPTSPGTPNVEAYQHWHLNEFDNTVVQTNEYEIAPASPPGCYTLWIQGTSRAFNPSGFDHGPGNDWYINQALIWRWTHRAISVVNA